MNKSWIMVEFEQEEFERIYRAIWKIRNNPSVQEDKDVINLLERLEDIFLASSCLGIKQNGGQYEN